MSEMILKMRLRAFHNEARREHAKVLVPKEIDDVARLLREGLTNVLSLAARLPSNYQKTRTALDKLGYLYALSVRFLASRDAGGVDEDAHATIDAFMEEIDVLAMSCFSAEAGFRIKEQPVTVTGRVAVIDGEVHFQGQKTHVTATLHNGVYLVVLAGLNFVELGEVPRRPTPAELYAAVMKIHAPSYLGETVYSNVWLVAPSDLVEFLDKTLTALNAPVEVGDLPVKEAKEFFSNLKGAEGGPITHIKVGSDTFEATADQIAGYVAALNGEDNLKGAAGGPVTHVKVGSDTFEASADQIDSIVAALIGEDPKTDVSVAPDGTITRMVEASRMASITLPDYFMEKVVDFIEFRKLPDTSEEERKTLREKTCESFLATVQMEAKRLLVEALDEAVANATTLLRQGLITRRDTKTLFLSVKTSLCVPAGLGLPTDNRVLVPNIAGDVVTTVVTGEALRSGEVILNYQFTFKD